MQLHFALYYIHQCNAMQPVLMGDVWRARTIGLQWSTSMKRLHHDIGYAANLLISTHPAHSAIEELSRGVRKTGLE